MFNVDHDEMLDEARNDLERRFLMRLVELAPPYCDVWTMLPQLIVTVCLGDPEDALVLRTLRVDFDGERFVAGNDPSHQIVDELDDDDPDRLESPEGLCPE